MWYDHLVVVKSLSRVQLFCNITRLLCPWDFSGKYSSVSSHFPLQGIFPTQESNLHLLHFRQILYCWAIREARDDLGGVLIFPHQISLERRNLWEMTLWCDAHLGPYACSRLVRTWRRWVIDIPWPSMLTTINLERLLTCLTSGSPQEDNEGQNVCHIGMRRQIWIECRNLELCVLFRCLISS